MSYQPLAIKYRPSKFHDLVGQESAALALRNAVAMGREPRAVLFTGVRGVGKTTVARLYAKTLNCKDKGEDREPCNQCESCLAIASGRHEDVLEIDGASNTGVNDVRALQETIDYVPQRSQFKVYIIDEVHMLSQAAFNALLKTLEEPPRHVVFIFATTELDKVPVTILSRCQAFYLKKLPTPLIRDRIRYILEAEGISGEEKAVALIAREGHGSMRDALTLLDQAIALGQGAVTVSGLGPVVSTMSSSLYIDLLEAMVHRNASLAMQKVAQLDQSGAEFRAVMEEIAQLARHAFILKGLGPEALDGEMLGLDDDELRRLRQLADAAQPLDLNRIFRTLRKARDEMDGSTLDRFVTENIIYEWCFDPGLPDVATLLGSGPRGGGNPSQGARGAETPRAARSPERPVERSGEPRFAERPAQQQGEPRPAERPAERPGEPRPIERPQDLRVGFPSTWRELLDAWREKKPISARKLEEAHPLVFSPERIVLGVLPESFASKALLAKEEQARVREQFAEIFGFKGLLTIESIKEQPGATDTLPQTVLVEREQEASKRRQDLLDLARTAPMTKDVVAVLGATIEDVRLSDH